MSGKPLKLPKEFFIKAREIMSGCKEVELAVMIHMALAESNRRGYLAMDVGDRIAVILDDNWNGELTSVGIDPEEMERHISDIEQRSEKKRWN